MKHARPRTHRLPRARHGVLASLLILSLAGCAAIPIILPMALEFARSLLNTSSRNYSSGYNDNLQALLLALVQRQSNVAGAGGYQPQWPTYGPGGNTMQAGPGTYSPGFPNTSPPGNTGPYPPVAGGSLYPPPYPNNQMSGGGPPLASYPPPPAGTQYPEATYPPPPDSVPSGIGTVPAPYPGTAPPPGSVYPPPPSPQPPAAGPAPDSSPPPTSNTPSPGPPVVSLPPIALDVALLRKDIVNGHAVPVQIKDGDVLKDGRGNPQAGDKFKIVFRPSIDCYVYVIAIDGSGWAQGLFPSKNSSQVNPVRKDQEYTLPEGAYWYSLDQFRGIETIYVVASYQQRVDIEQILTKIAGRERPATQVPERVEQAPVLPNGFSTAQPGQPAVVKTESGEATVTPTTSFKSQAGEDLRVTRWFRHE